MSNIRVRFAPSPTGALHIGGVRTALYNYLFAKKHGGTFILRIEDTDQGRYVPGAEEYIIEALRWCGIMPTEGQGLGGPHAPYRQSERKDLYQKHAQDLIASGKAYYAFDTPDELEAARATNPNFKYDAQSRTGLSNALTLSADEVQRRLNAGHDYVIRLKVPENEVVTFTDLIRGEVSFATSELDDKVLMKSDGMPTYHLANIVDDHLMEITHVIRGEEWLPSTGHHVLLYRAFGWSQGDKDDTMPQFAHLPLILKPDGKGKLSKRDGAKFGMPVFPLGWDGETEEDSFRGFREFGFLPQAVINFLAFLGWNPGTEQEIFSLDELCEAFSIEKISKSGARFDYDKAKWYNQQYLHAMDDMQLAELLRPIVEEKQMYGAIRHLPKICHMMKERVTFLPDILEQAPFLFGPVQDYDIENIVKRWKPESRPVFEALAAVVKEVEPFEVAQLEAAVKQFMAEQGKKPGEIMPILRLSLAGTMQGPGVFEMMDLFEKRETMNRLIGSIGYFDTLI